MNDTAEQERASDFVKLACLCGRKVPQIDIMGPANKVPIAVCTCGVRRIAASVSPSGVAATYAGGEYHSSTTRHPGVVPYVDRYEEDLRVAKLRYDQYLARQLVGPRALDVGCANGAFVDYLRNVHEENAWGCDPDPRWARHHILHGTLADVLRHDHEPWQTITYHDVLEHLVDPAGEVMVAATALKKYGTLVIEVPDIHVVEGAKHYKAEHLWYFTVRSLVDIVQAAGLLFSTVQFPIPGKMTVYATKVPR